MSKNKEVTGHIQWARMLKKLNPYTIRKGLRYFKHYGPKEFWVRLHERFEPEEVPYGPCYEAYIPDDTELEKQRKHKFSYSPLISVAVPAFRTPEVFLRQMIDSLLAQTYSNWELCIANGSPEDKKMQAVLDEYANKDSRIRVKILDQNLGIAGNTNAALEMIQGEYAGILDHDDLLAPNTLYEIARYLENNPDADGVYTDEDKVTTELDEHFQPHLKPDFNLDLLRSNNYICHFFVVRQSIIRKVGGFRQEFDGAQDYDFILRCCEQTEHIAHVPKVLYHWRAHDNSTAGNPESKQYAVDAGKRALEEHYRRMGYEAVVENTGIFIVYRTIMKVQGNPKVSVIILNKDHREDLEKCVVSIEEKTDYPNYEIIVVENNSELPETFAFYEELQRRYSNVKVVTWDGPFNYSAINNYGAEYATGDYYLMLNNDIEVISPGWMSEMLGYCQREDVGIVGAKLYYSDDTVQHAGVVVGVGGFAGHVLTRFRKGETGYFGRLVTIQDTSAVTAACLMIKKSIYQLIGGFDEEFVVALNDIDLCLKVRALGQLVVFNPYAELYHYESKSRGFEDTPEKKARFKKEIKRFREKWGEILSKGDPYYNPNLTLVRGDCSIRSGYEKFEIVEEIEKGIE